MFEIKVSQEIKNTCPVFAGAAVYAAVKNTAYCDGLWKEINTFTEDLTTTTQMADIKLQPVIAATREAYKRCGKDPGRYRPSAEALRRRLMRGIPLYQIDTLVDLINLVSLRTGHSIGGFDADKIQGKHLELGIGKAEEPFEGIGRGILNIEGLPVYRDSFGGIGTPTSDHERTKMDVGTTHILAIVNGYNGKEGLKEAAEMIQSLLRDYASGSEGYGAGLQRPDLIEPAAEKHRRAYLAVFLTQGRSADDRRPDDADCKGVHAEDGHHQYAIPIGAPSRPAPSALPSGLQPGREQRADHFRQEHQDSKRQGLPGADREVRIVSRTGKGRRTAGAIARTRQDQIRNLRCDQRLSAQMQKLERTGR